jgi:site-specific DNA-cytosine methylase
MTVELTQGSLFDGIGGFPHAGRRHGVRPVWASEIEAFPTKVTALRIPGMEHLGAATGAIAAEHGMKQQTFVAVPEAISIQGNLVDRDTSMNGSGISEGIAHTLTAADRHAVACYDARGNGGGETAATLVGDHQNRVTDYTTLIAFNMRGREAGNVPEVDPETLANFRASRGGSSATMISHGYRVRRLTPFECERLQGLPDGWTDIPGAKDSPRYKALGNSVAQPSTDYVVGQAAKYIRRRCYGEQNAQADAVVASKGIPERIRRGRGLSAQHRRQAGGVRPGNPDLAEERARP